jgi:hypothetical protein
MVHVPAPASAELLHELSSKHFRRGEVTQLLKAQRKWPLGSQKHDVESSIPAVSHVAPGLQRTPEPQALRAPVTLSPSRPDPPFSDALFPQARTSPPNIAIATRKIILRPRQSHSPDTMGGAWLHCTE